MKYISQKKRNFRTASVAIIAVFVMLGLSYASVPLYRLFCQVTGYGGTPKIVQAPSEAIGSRIIKVRFNADTAGGMPWHFRPMQQELSVKVGEQVLAFYTASNPTNRRIVGTATFNVTPLKAATYFSKIDCFCFTEQILDPGSEIDMPVTFFVDPEIDSEPTLADIKTITLSYTFFEASADEKRKPKETSEPEQRA